MRRAFLATSGAVLAIIAGVATVWPPVLWALLVVVPVVLRGIADLVQTKQAVRRNFPVIGHGRYLLEQIRPEINQYFVESNHDGRPFSRNDRSVVYQRAKGELDTLPFGTQRDVYAVGYEWINHSLAPVAPDESLSRVDAERLGDELWLAEQECRAGVEHRYQNGREPGGDLIWQIGTGYSSCRTPRHGGILPAAKLTPEIVAIRGVVPGLDVVSSQAHRVFDAARPPAVPADVARGVGWQAARSIPRSSRARC